MDEASCQVHWLRMVTDADLPTVQDIIPGDWPLGDADGPGGFNQPASVQSSAGFRVFHGKDNQPRVIECDGDCCDRNGYVRVAEAGRSLDAWVTRCDLAVDLEPANQARRRLLAVRREFKRGRADTRLKLGALFMAGEDEEQGGYTQYVGSKSSEILIRLYDRRGPLRIEVQFMPANKQLRKMWLNVLLQQGPWPLWRGLASVLRLPKVSWWEQLLDGKTFQRVPPDDDDLEVERLLESIRDQCGKTLWALTVGGVELGQLLAVEPERPRGRDLRKFAAIAAWMKVNGHDSVALEEAIRCKSRPSVRR